KAPPRSRPRPIARGRRDGRRSRRHRCRRACRVLPLRPCRGQQLAYRRSRPPTRQRHARRAAPGNDVTAASAVASGPSRTWGVDADVPLGVVTHQLDQLLLRVEARRQLLTTIAEDQVAAASAVDVDVLHPLDCQQVAERPQRTVHHIEALPDLPAGPWRAGGAPDRQPWRRGTGARPRPRSPRWRGRPWTAAWSDRAGGEGRRARSSGGASALASRRTSSTRSANVMARILIDPCGADCRIRRGPTFVITFP